MADARAMRRPHGVIMEDGQEVADTAQCCHCGAHFVVVRGSGKTRGFCTECMGPTCGKPECDGCVTFERRFELYEKGRIPNPFISAKLILSGDIPKPPSPELKKTIILP